MIHEAERNGNETEEESDNADQERISFLTSVVQRIMNAPMQKTTPTMVDVVVTKEEVRIISNYAAASFASQNSLMRITEEQLPICVVGDLHGHLSNLRDLFSINGPPGVSRYVFLGDYVDRGRQGLETAMLLFAYHCLHPDHLFLCRGNHEDYNTTLTYGFYDECRLKEPKKGDLVWLHVINAFNHLPFAALLFDKVLCMHGGISPHITKLDDIDCIARPTFIPAFGLACDLVWSDPEDSKNIGWSLSARGISFSYDDVTIEKFCEANGLDLIVRAHQISSDMIKGGHKWHANGRMVTIFSAANYLGMGNDSAVLHINEHKNVQFLLQRPIRATLKRSKSRNSA
uniref:SER_THR_PHOSPHATASE domain-containing protein n=1 Tax=Caenorhabditis japonica TaxID=281687 RepID=A0A8R1HJ86_CAEJA